eukprot:scaffold47243_cov54-Phaeocystis_antarctica.AAC.2
MDRIDLARAQISFHISPRVAQYSSAPSPPNRQSCPSCIHPSSSSRTNASSASTLTISASPRAAARRGPPCLVTSRQRVA